MSLSEEVAPLLSPLVSLQWLLARFDDQGIENLPHLMAVAAEEGLVPRIADAEAFARRHRVLLLRHDASGISVDISLGMLPFEVEAVERSIVHEVGSVAIRLPTPEDLIIFKAVAHW